MRLTRPARLAGLVALAMAAVPAAATAAPSATVCNQASPHFQGGGLVALDPPTDSPAARFTTNLTPLPGEGEGLVRAAAESPALTICGPGNDDGGGISVS